MSSNKESPKKTTTSNTDPQVVPGSGEKLVNKQVYSLMDNNNKKAADVMASKGIEAAVEHMLKHPETGKKMDYATMRYYYG
jgi:hypothetical protein